MRSFKYKRFTVGTDDPSEVIETSLGGDAGYFAVYTRKISGAGSATLAVSGSFKSAPAADDLFAIQTATSVGAGPLTNLMGASEENRFPYLTLALDRTGSCVVDVYVSMF